MIFILGFILGWAGAAWEVRVGRLHPIEQVKSSNMFLLRF